MIGKEVRSNAQLCSLVKSGYKWGIVFSKFEADKAIFKHYKMSNKDLSYDMVSAFYRPMENQGYYLDDLGGYGVNDFASENDYNEYRHLTQKYKRNIRYISRKDADTSVCYRSNNIWIMNESDMDSYNSFLDTHKSFIKKFLGKRKLDDGSAFIAFALCNDSKNYFQWIYKILIDEQHYTNICSIIRIMNWAKHNHNLVSKLSKSTITAYKTRQIQELLNEIFDLQISQIAASVINNFNTEQRKILKSVSLSTDNKLMFCKFNKLSETKKRNFIRKVSTLEDGNEIIDQLSMLTGFSFKWGKECLLSYISYADGIHCKIIYDKDNILILRIDDYKSIYNLAKATNWCISKNKQYWHNYVISKECAEQYMIFNFDMPEDDNNSIIGVTVEDGFKITDAHDFVNHDLLGDADFREDDKNPKKFNQILKEFGISMDIFYSKCDTMFGDDKKSVIKELNETIGEYSYEILSDFDNKLVIKTTNTDVAYSIGDFAINPDFSYDGYILFFDFNKKTSDRLVVIPFEKKGVNKKIITDSPFDLIGNVINNLSFFELLKMFNIDTDVLPFPQNKKQMFDMACNQYDIKTVFNYLDDPEIVSYVKTIKSRARFYNEKKYGTSLNPFQKLIRDSLFDFHTLDIFNKILSNGINLMDVFSPMDFRQYIYTPIINSVVHSTKEEYNSHETELTEEYVHGVLNDKNKKGSVEFSICVLLYVYYHILNNEFDSFWEYFILSYEDFIDTSFIYTLNVLFIDKAFAEKLDFSKESTVCFTACEIANYTSDWSDYDEQIRKYPSVLKDYISNLESFEDEGEYLSEEEYFDEEENYLED